MISTLISIKHRCPRLWQLVEALNGRIFSFRYPRFKKIANEVLSNNAKSKFRLSIITPSDLPNLETLHKSCPNDYIKYFSPHDFAQSTLHRLYNNPSFLMMKALDKVDGKLVGYFFLRAFFIGKAFHGLFVSKEVSGQHLGSTMWYVSQHICEQCGIRMYATISKDNQPSIRSANNGTKVVVLEQLDNNYIHIECKRKDEADF
jgi:hypothetical protein